MHRRTSKGSIAKRRLKGHKVEGHMEQYRHLEILYATKLSQGTELGGSGEKPVD